MHNRGVILYECYDVHYYLKDWIPCNPGPYDMIYTTGANFCHMNGKYTLPCKEGGYTVLDGNVTMRTSISGDAGYHHPLV